MSEYLPTPISKLPSIIKSTPITVKLCGKTLSVETLMSKKGQEYQLITFADNTGVRLIINCTSTKVEANQNYQMLLKATKKNNYSSTLFLDRVQISPRVEVINPVVDPELEWLNEHILIKDLIVKKISPVTKTEDLYSSLNKNLGVYEEEVSDLEGQDVLLKLEDECGMTYYYRVWADDPSIQVSDITTESIIRFKHYEINKQKGATSTRNLVKCGISSLQILE